MTLAVARTTPPRRREPRPVRTVDGDVCAPRDLVLDARLSAVERILLMTLTDRQPSTDWWTIKTDAEIIALHGVSEGTVQAALRHGEDAGWIARMSARDLKAWLERIGRSEIWGDLPTAARSAKRVIVRMDRFTARCERAALDVHLAPDCDLEVSTGCDLPPDPGAPSATLTAPDCEVAPDCQSLACAHASNRPDHDHENESSRSRGETPAGARVPPRPRTGMEPGGFARMFPRLIATGERNDLEAASNPPPPPRRPDPPPAPAEAPRAARAAPPPPSVRRLALDLVRQLGGADPGRAVDGLVVLLATELGVPAGDDTTLRFWERSIARFGESEGGRVALGEILGYVFGPKVENRAHCLSACLGREHRAWGAQRSGPRVTRQSPPGTGWISDTPCTLSNRTRRVNP